MVKLDNPYLSFFQALPVSFRRNPSDPLSSMELAMPEWLRLKSAIATHFAWAVPTDEAIDLIRSYGSSVIEIGCGSGYWAWLMQQAGINVIAIDSIPPPFSWHTVEPGDELVVALHPDKTLFLCWPPWGSAMAYRALINYTGSNVIYVGEWLGGSADLWFFARLNRDFEAIAASAIPQWFMRNDSLIVFRRRKAPELGRA
jgi:hypothetical protein